MAVNIGPKIGIDGEAEYRQEINQIITQAKTLSSEMKVVTSSFDKDTSAKEKASKTTEVLNKQIENQEKMVDKINAQLQEATKKYGENDAKTQKWKQALNNATAELNTMKGELKNVGGSMDDTAKKTSTFGEVLKANLVGDAIKSAAEGLKNAITGIGDALKNAVTSSAQFADNILTASTTTGLSTTSLQEFTYMAELADTSLDTITGSLTKLSKSMYSASTGSKESAEAFSKFGVEIKDAQGNLRSNEDVFYDLLEAMQKMPNETERDALAMQVFGRSAKDLYPLMEQGRAGIEALRLEAQQTGYVLNDEQLAALGAVDDAYQRWNNTLTTVQNQIAVGVAPALETFMTAIQNMVAQIDWEAVGQSLGNLFAKLVDTLATIDLSTVIDSIVQAILAFIDAIAQIDFSALFTGVSDIMDFISKHGTEVAVAIGAIVTIITALQIASLATTPAVVALAGTLAPFIAPIAAVVAAIVGLIAIIKNWGAISDWLKETWNKAKDAVIGIFTRLKEKVAEAFGNMGNAVKDKVTNIKDTVSGIFNKIKEIISGVISNALNWGKDLVQGLIDGIKSKIQKVKDTVAGIADTIASWLHFSRPDVGPLRYYEQWMPDFMEGLANGIEQNTGLITSAMRGVTDEMTLTPTATATVQNPGTIGGGNVINITINGGADSAEQIADAVMDKLQLAYERTAQAW